MNKELEEAIKRCKKIITEKFNLDYSIDNVDKEAIVTVLQALENSIPKETIKDKIKELEKIAKKADIIPETVKEERIDGSFVYSQRFNADGYIAQAIIKVLQDLLEEK